MYQDNADMTQELVVPGSDGSIWSLFEVRPSIVSAREVEMALGT